MPQPTNDCGDILVKERFAFIHRRNLDNFILLGNEQGAHAGVIYAPYQWGVLYTVRRGLLFVATEGQSRASAW